MKTSGVLKAAAFMAIGGVCFSTAAMADSRNSDQLIYPNGKSQDKYVFVTGSHIPQRVKVKSIGTAAQSPIRVYGQTEIDRTGRQTAAGILALDPSIQVRSGGRPSN